MLLRAKTLLVFSPGSDEQTSRDLGPSAESNSSLLKLKPTLTINTILQISYLFIILNTQSASVTINPKYHQRSS